MGAPSIFWYNGMMAFFKSNEIEIDISLDKLIQKSENR